MIDSDPAGTRPAPWDYAAPWGARGYLTDLDGPVHWIEFTTEEPDKGQGTSASQPPIVFVHGLGGSHLNWCPLGPRLAAGRRAVALDLHGFGLTPGLRANSTVQANARLLDRWIQTVVGEPVILVGNSMGGLISILETSNNPDAHQGPGPARPRPPAPAAETRLAGQRPVPALRHTRPGRIRRRQADGQRLAGKSRPAARPALLRRPVASRPRDDPGRGRAQHQASPGHARPGAARARIFLAAARSLLRVLSRRQRFAKMMAGIDVPVLLIGGEDDRLVPVAAMRQAAARNPRWESVILPGVGHTPMLEVPDDTSAVIRDWLDRHFKS